MKPDTGIFKSLDTNNSPAIELSEVSFSYNGVVVLDSVSFTVPRGTSMAMVGPNGGGKTTLLRIILGLLKPGRGNVTVLGRSPAQAHPYIGYMPQYMHFDLKFPVSVMDVVLMGRLGVNRRFGSYRAEDRNAALASLERVELGGFESRPFSDLSGGQRQRVLIARAIVSDPELLLLDEPTANVDSAAGAQFYKLLRELARHMTILLVTHDIGYVSSMMNDVICVNRNVHIHPTREVSRDSVMGLYEGEVREILHGKVCGEDGVIKEK